ncbi:hypothetical protein Lal_00033741 [Lupinus albus]|nr:hypothetical protein Lal_00033741 [Lupinus albus]
MWMDDEKRAAQHILKAKKYHDSALVLKKCGMIYKMFPNESISYMHKRFTNIVNHLVALDKYFAKGELTNNVLTCLDMNWHPKVTVIMESKDLDSMPLATLFCKIQEYEMELSRLTFQEDIFDIDYDSKFDDETMTLLVRKFMKFLKRKGGLKQFQQKEAKDSTGKGNAPKERLICHECGKS